MLKHKNNVRLSNTMPASTKKLLKTSTVMSKMQIHIKKFNEWNPNKKFFET